MKIKHLSLLYFMLAFVVVNAQERISAPQLSKNRIPRAIVLEGNLKLKKDTIQVADTIRTVGLGGEIYANKLIISNRRDTLVYVAKDHPEVSELDAFWREELSNTTLFDTIYRSVRELSYDTIYYPELSTDTLKARLAVLNSRTPFNVEYNQSLESVIKGYLKYRRKHIERLMGLSEFYFPMFEQELDNHNLPLEIKYLAIVESALKPRAKSRVGATGLWQFMYGTGKQFGLEVSSYVDERMDPIMATKAASAYLKKLHKIFGDWDLALASYNSGPGNVTKAIRRSGGYTNYWNIRHNLPRETAGYVPAFLATMYIFEYADEHGFKPNKPDFTYFKTDTIKIKQQISLDHVSEFMNIDKKELQFLNPSYKLDIIPFIKDEDYVLRLPLDKIGVFVANENQVYALAKQEFDKREKQLPTFFEAKDKIRYRVRSGDFLGKIAQRHGVRVSQLKRWNGLRSNHLKIGQRLTIYPKNPPTNVAAKKTTPKSAIASNSSNDKIYTVKSGDTLWSISKKFSGVSIDNLKSWNNIRGNGIKPGMKLKISKS